MLWGARGARGGLAVYVSLHLLTVTYTGARSHVPHSTCFVPGVPISVLRGSSITLALPWLLGIYHWAWRQGSKENFADRLSLELWRLPGWAGL